MKKRTILAYLFTFCVMLFSFSAVYMFNYVRLKSETLPYTNDEQNEQQNTVQKNEEQTSQSETDSVANELIQDTTAPAQVEADAGKVVKTNRSMLYVVGQYDWITGIVTETVEKFPDELLDMTRQELLVFLREHPEYGTLLSFSEHAVYLRKSDDRDWSEYTYYLILEEDGLKVYYLDQTTLYLDTGILPDELNAEDRELLEEGFYIKDTSGLFDYLQTVTS